MITIDNGLTFDEDKHEYTIDGFKVPSVTQITGMLTDKYAERTPVIENAARRGTLIHSLCEDYDWQRVDGDTEIDPETAVYLKAYAEFKADYKPVWFFSELPLGSREWGFAGTLDRFGLINGKHAIVDIKTTANFDKAAKVALAVQLHAYEQLALESGLISKNMEVLKFGVQLRKDGTYKVIRVDDINDKAWVAFRSADVIWDNLLMAWSYANKSSEQLNKEYERRHEDE